MPTFNSTRNLQGLLNLIQLLTMAMHWCCEYCINSFLKDSISLFLACSVTCPSDDLGRAVIGSGNHHQRPPGTSSTPPHPSCSLPFNPNLQHSLSTAAHRKPTDKSATLPSSKYSELPSSVELDLSFGGNRFHASLEVLYTSVDSVSWTTNHTPHSFLHRHFFDFGHHGLRKLRPSYFHPPSERKLPIRIQS